MKLTFKIVYTNGNIDYSISETIVFGHLTNVIFFTNTDGNEVNKPLSDIKEIKHLNIK